MPEPSQYVQPVNNNLRCKPDKNGILHVCSYCDRCLEEVPGKMNRAGLPYQEIGQHVPGHNKMPNVSHGYCLNCYEDMMRDIEGLPKAEWSFKEWIWLESQGNLLKLYDVLMSFYHGASPWKNKNYHYALVQALKDAGLLEDAAEISRLEPTDEEIQYARQPYGGGMTLGDVLKNKNNQRIGEIFSMKHADYRHKIEELMDKLEGQGIGTD